MARMLDIVCSRWSKFGHNFEGRFGARYLVQKGKLADGEESTVKSYMICSTKQSHLYTQGRSECGRPATSNE
jgi:hypothetical protein